MAKNRYASIVGNLENVTMKAQLEMRWPRMEARYDSFLPWRAGHEVEDLVEMFPTASVAWDAGSNQQLDFDPDSPARQWGHLPEKTSRVELRSAEEREKFFRILVGKDRRVLVRGNRIESFGCSGVYWWEVA